MLSISTIVARLCFAHEAFCIYVPVVNIGTQKRLQREKSCLDNAGTSKMIARITSSPEPSNHSIVLALPSNIQLIFHKAPNKSWVSLIIELAEVFVGEQPNNSWRL